MSHLRVRVLFAVLLAAAAWSCGGDDDSTKPTGGNTDGGTLLRDGGTAGKSGTSGTGGAGSVGSGDEGFPCQSASDCGKTLACVENIFSDQNGQPIGVCARSCKTDPDCDDKEMCFSYTGKDQDKHCVNLVTDEYGSCGVGETSVCKARSCLYFPNEPVGVCIDTCALDGSATADAGAEDDGGMATTTAPKADGGAPAGAVMCKQGEMCIDGVLSDAASNEGVCGTVVDRSAACGLSDGKYCNKGDICAPEDPNDLQNSTPRCFEDCGATGGTCKKGSCVVVQQSFAYCM